MNKKLIALAVAGACVAPAAMAQTANPVVLYGIMEATFESVEAKGGSPSVLRRNRVQDQSSRVGFRGTEDLGGGLKAFFQFETGIVVDTGGGVWANRNSGGGLQGNWGAVLIGRWDTPYKFIQYEETDPWGLLTIANSAMILGDSANFIRRENNVVQYWSPTIGGFSARVHYSANELRTASVNPTVYSANVKYKGGPFYIGYGWEEHKDQNGSTVVAGNKETGQILSAAFTVGPVKLGATAEEIKETGRAKMKSFYVSAIHTMGPWKFQGMLGETKGGHASGAEPKAKGFALGVVYSLSKRTTLQAMYAELDNNATSARNFGFSYGAVPGVVANSDPTGFGVGFRHTF